MCGMLAVLTTILKIFVRNLKPLGPRCYSITEDSLSGPRALELLRLLDCFCG